MIVGGEEVRGRVFGSLQRGELDGEAGGGGGGEGRRGEEAEAGDVDVLRHLGVAGAPVHGLKVRGRIGERGDEGLESAAGDDEVDVGGERPGEELVADPAAHDMQGGALSIREGLRAVGLQDERERLLLQRRAVLRDEERGVFGGEEAARDRGKMVADGQKLIQHIILNKNKMKK